MKKNLTLIGFGCIALLASLIPFGAFAQSEKSVVVGISVWTGYPNNVKGFKDAMTAGGFIEGKNVKYLYGKSGPSKEKQREIAQGFKDADVDLVYTLTTPGTTIIKEIMPEDTPIVFSIVTYPADSGLIESFEYSGNNLVGTSNYVPLSNYITLLKTILPDTKSVAIFHRKGEPNSKIQAANVIRLLKRAGIQSVDREPTTVEETRQMAQELVGTVDVFMTTTDTLMQGGGEQVLIEISLDKKIPILSSNKAGIEAGSTFGPVADFYTLGNISGEMAVQILKDNVEPARLQSKLQEPPAILANKKSIEKLGIEISGETLESLRYVD